MASKTSKAIDIINRRADSIKKLFGEYSEEYDLIKAQMSRFDISINEKTGTVHIRNTKQNRTMYRQLNAMARRIKKTPITVVKRKAEKKKAAYEKARREYEDAYTESGEPLNGKLDQKTYNNWLATFEDYFASCYDLASMMGYASNEALEVADALYDDKQFYDDTWNQFYMAGAFDEFKDAAQTYDEQAFYNKFGLDPETGEPIINADFF